MFAARNVIMTGKNPVAFDAVGPGAFQGNSTSNITLSWTHTPVSANPSAGLVLVSYESIQTNDTMTATWGGVSMTSLGKVIGYGSVFSFPNTYYYHLEVFGLLKPPTGARTISTTHGGAATVKYDVANSLTYTGVQGFGPVATSQSGSTNTTARSGGALTVASAINERIVVLLGDNNISSTGFSAFSGTTRYSKNWTFPVNPTILIGDGPSGASQTAFTATSGTSSIWAAVSVRLLP
jgi:hypothetical protein